MIDNIHKYRVLNKLKSVYRFSSVDSRKESSAEHTWGTLVLADFFMSSFDFAVDRLKVYELLMYHDVPEIYAGDTVLHPELFQDSNFKVEKETLSANRLKDELPSPINSKFFDLFNEFESAQTREAKFAKAIDALEAEIHEMDYKEDWKGWSRDFLVENKAFLFVDFPELEVVFFELLDFFVENGYFDQ